MQHANDEDRSLGHSIENQMALEIIHWDSPNLRQRWIFETCSGTGMRIVEEVQHRLADGMLPLWCQIFAGPGFIPIRLFQNVGSGRLTDLKA